MQNYIRLAADATQQAPSNQSLIILITGFVVVFLVLLLLIGLIKLYSGIVYAAQNKAKAKAKPAQPALAPVAAEAVTVAPASHNEGLDLQTVAVITAAVEAFYGSTKKVRVTGIRPANTARNEWANAGIRENIPAMRTEGLL
ncbi:MAG: OadG family protein [Ruminococcus sp.]|nr:OadG family protein [Ruminococcus sp.]